MKFSIGTLLAIVTMIGSILIGGANFGEVRGITIELSKRLDFQETKLQMLEQSIKELNSRTIKIEASLEWLVWYLKEQQKKEKN